MNSPTTLSTQPLPLHKDEGNDEKCVQNFYHWLNLHQVWGKLPADAKDAIAQSSHYLQVAPQTLIYQEGQTPTGVYLLKSGTVEIFQSSPIGQLLIRYRNPGDLFGYTLIANGVEGTYQTSAIALTQSEICFLPKAAFHQLIVAYPAIQQVIHSRLAEDLQEYTTRIAWSQVRIQCLQSYIQPVPHQTHIIGSSKATQKLTEQINQAAKNLQPVIFQAQPGTGKTFVAGLIHTRSELASQPFAELDCSDLPRAEDGRLNTDALFGRVGQQQGIVELIERGTILLDNVHVLSEGDRSRLIHYLKTGFILPNHGIVGKVNLVKKPPQLIQSGVRLILASPHKLELPDINTITIKLFPLPQRKADIADFAHHFLEQFCREQNRPLLQLDQSDLRRLISYDYPGNIGELAEILHRAVMMTPSGHSTIPEQALWSVQSTKNAFRLDLLTHVPWLRQIFLSRWYPEAIWWVMMAVFVPVTVLGFLGPQPRDSSVTLNLFWAWWWPGYLFLFVFVGRLWCAVCPFMIAGEWMRRISLWLFPRQQLTWNHQWLNRWGGWVVFSGFVAIYLWEKLWDLPHHAYLSAWLLLTITAGAVICSVIYERRLWCRHLCPIGGMNGMFAKLSMMELRSVQQMCGSQCNTFGCYKGTGPTLITFAGALPEEGQATGGCPLYSHPAQLQDNRDCMLCMTCLKGCPNRSAQLNWRFPASDLLDNHKGFWAEAALLLLLLGGVFMHHGDRILAWLGWGEVPVDADHLLISIPIALVLLSIPAALTYITHAIARCFDSEQPDYLTVIYAYLPLTLAANLTHYIPAAMTEAGQILPVLAQTLGYSSAGLPTLTWSWDVAQFLQGITLLSALVFSPYPLWRITGRSLFSNIPHLLLMLSFTVLFFQLMI
ncbi:sigma-54 interaction domain family [Richelia sinica FACHB-800]|uniref:Sigma-54 interaction domain family n=1 Tax=Richelia sinica FACHB-800 TaxID=1357546 RepID=A0A975T4C5_9NOST|nr:cyclic nucleotide-binding domain-containing protein [Richelia sinica]MBD2663069.1 cyclic nucleotide-binding domain-containing protein [Richelia sinica FACHB-800]QXE21933.1 sigma-54 interaction domain family [Richelia sinica FACHB-800]